MNEREIEVLLDANERQYVLLGEIRDLLAARLPVPVEDLPAPTSESKLDKMRQSNAELRKANADILLWHRESMQRLRDVCQSIITRIGSSGQETAEDALARLFAKLADTEKENADLRAELAALKAAAQPAPEVSEQPQGKTGRYVLVDTDDDYWRYYDKRGWRSSASQCTHPWRTKACAKLAAERFGPNMKVVDLATLDAAKEATDG